MNVTRTGEDFATVMANLVSQAKNLTTKTTVGTEFHVYEPITIGKDYISFSGARGRSGSTNIIRFDAIASVMFPAGSL